MSRLIHSFLIPSINPPHNPIIIIIHLPIFTLIPFLPLLLREDLQILHLLIPRQIIHQIKILQHRPMCFGHDAFRLAVLP